MWPQPVETPGPENHLRGGGVDGLEGGWGRWQQGWMMDRVGFELAAGSVGVCHGLGWQHCGVYVCVRDVKGCTPGRSGH